MPRHGQSSALNRGLPRAGGRLRNAAQGACRLTACGGTMDGVKKGIAVFESPRTLVREDSNARGTTSFSKAGIGPPRRGSLGDSAAARGVMWSCVRKRHERQEAQVTRGAIERAKERCHAKQVLAMD